MSDYLASTLLVIFGAVAICFGIYGDFFNFGLGFSGRRENREQPPRKHVSPITLAPVIANSFGLMLICLALRLPLLWFAFGVVFAVFFHLLGLAFCGR